MSDITLGKCGLELDAPSPGDIVTVLIRPPSVKSPAPAGPSLYNGLFGHREWAEHENPQHYRINAIWRVDAVNGAQAVVTALTGHAVGRREVWSIRHHRWFDASELWAALQPAADASA